MEGRVPAYLVRGVMRVLTFLALLLQKARSWYTHIRQYFSPRTYLSPYFNPPPSEETRERIQSIFDILECEPDCDFVKIKRLLDDCPSHEALHEVVTDNGYNIFQEAVIRNNALLVKALIRKGFSVDQGRCSKPIHLACKLGHLDLVKILIENGAKTDIETGMCYPNSHLPHYQPRSKFQFMDKDIFDCDRDHMLPLLYAIQGNHVDIVRLLLENQETLQPVWLIQKYPLHYACHSGSFDCMKYLLEQCPTHLKLPDSRGLYPLHYSVQWTKQQVQYLIESNANVHVISNNGETALHSVFNTLKNPLEINRITKLLLGTGMEQDVNIKDRQGDLALHALVTHVNRRVSFFQPAKETPIVPLSQRTRFAEIQEDPLGQSEYQTEVLKALDTLLKYNCEANVQNKNGFTPLHKLLLVFNHLISNPREVYSKGRSFHDTFLVDFDILCKAVEILLTHGSDPNAMTMNGRPALTIILKGILNTDPALLPKYSAGFLRLIDTLCRHGADCNAMLASPSGIVALLARFGQRIVGPDGLRWTGNLKQLHASFLNDLLQLFLRHNLNPNCITNMTKKHLEGGSGNGLIEFVRLTQSIRTPSDLDIIYDWILTLLQWGANPDIEPYPSEPIICHSQSSIFLKPKGTQAVNHYMYDIQDFRSFFDGGHAERLLYLFYNVMDHEPLFQCLGTAKFMSRFDPHRAPNGQFMSILQGLSKEPRSLKQIARVSIYKAMGRRLATGVPQLHYPNPLKKYLLDVE
ncbi:unnamed protein product [Owenia fusiformis]|uniref:Uncharacterized protein n=1 Tax=Owenia fusiformis TaxID=6347 RepID=A0A8J1TCV0_OWEFU|nr:unnamed protein product [Owenia fusiformis]